jgi:hypothetical protein
MDAEASEPKRDDLLNLDSHSDLSDLHESIASLLVAKKAKIQSMKGLAQSEARLSFSALSLLLISWLAVTVVAATLWISVNAFIVFALSMYTSALIALGVIFAINFICLLSTLKFIKSTRKDIGFKNTIETIRGNL